MNQTLHPDGSSDAPWPAVDKQLLVPDTSMVPGSDNALPEAVGLLRNVASDAHDTADHLAVGAAPVAHQPDASASAAGDALLAKTDQLGNTRSEWVESLRTKVRGNPLAFVAAAATLGAVIARYARDAQTNR